MPPLLVDPNSLPPRRPTPPPRELRDALAEVVGPHSYTYPDSFCECGAWVNDHRRWTEHLADVLVPNILASDVIAQAREAGARDVAERVEAVLRDWARGIEADDLNPSDAEPFARMSAHVRAALPDQSSAPSPRRSD